MPMQLFLEENRQSTVLRLIHEKCATTLEIKSDIQAKELKG